jgi:hypothetical protein
MTVRYMLRLSLDNVVHDVLVIADGVVPTPEYLEPGTWAVISHKCGVGWQYDNGRVYPLWRQPMVAEGEQADPFDGYPLGAEVWHAADAWTSDAGNNSEEPGVSGWTLIVR